MLLTMSPPDVWRYLKELAEGLAAVGDDAEAAMELRKELSEKYDGGRRTATAGYQLSGQPSTSKLYLPEYVE